MIPTVGRIVHYTLAAGDVAGVGQHRTLAEGAKVGNDVREGGVYPMVIVRVWSDQDGGAVNGQVLLDGNDSLWVSSRCEGDTPGTWAAPPRV